MVLSTDQIKLETDDATDIGPKVDLTANHHTTNSGDIADTTDSSTPPKTEDSESQDVEHRGPGKVPSQDTDLDSEEHRTTTESGQPQHLSETSKKSTESPDVDDSVGRKLTNFSIDRILRSDFGPTRSSRYDDSVRKFSMSVSSSSLPLFSSSSLFCTVGVSSRFSSVLSAFSSSPTSAFVPKKSSSKHSGSRGLSSSSLTHPPPSLKSSSSSSAPSSSSSRQRIPPSSPNSVSSSRSDVTVTSTVTSGERKGVDSTNGDLPWPAWVYCTRYSDRPSSGPRYRKPRQSKATDKRPRTAFTSGQLQRLRTEFQDCPYLSESRRISLARELGLSESQVKIWFQNKRAKLKKGCGVRNPLARLLMEEGLYNHSTIVVRDGQNDSDSSNKEMAQT